MKIRIDTKDLITRDQKETLLKGAIGVMKLALFLVDVCVLTLIIGWLGITLPFWKCLVIFFFLKSWFGKPSSEPDE